MTTIYVVTEGEYSSYGIVGVFDNEEDANVFAKRFSFDGPQVEEWELNPGIRELRAGLNAYYIRMAYDGTVQHCNLSDTVPGQHHTSWFPADSCMGTTMWAKDTTHAIKIANERRTQAIAMGFWGERWPEENAGGEK